MYGSDRTLQHRFPVDDVLFQEMEIFAIKSQNGIVKNYVFRPKIFGEKDPQNQMRTFYAAMGTHQVGKFGAIPPTNPDGIRYCTFFVQMYNFTSFQHHLFTLQTTSIANSNVHNITLYDVDHVFFRRNIEKMLQLTDYQI